MVEIDEITTRNLIYVKRLYMHGHDHLHYDTEFDRMIAIHNFDNAVELLLKCAAKKYDIPFKDPLKILFPALWNNVNEKFKETAGSDLPKKTEMFQLHEFRCDVQHWGRSPFSSDDVNRFDVYVLDFVKNLLDSIFKLKYTELSLSSLVNDAEIRKLLLDAEQYISSEEWKESIHSVAEAFAIAKWKTSMKLDIWLSPFLSPSIPSDPLVRQLQDIVEMVRIVALKIECEKYARFKEKTPVVILIPGGKSVIQVIRKLNYTKENAIYCYDFAVDSITRWRL